MLTPRMRRRVLRRVEKRAAARAAFLKTHNLEPYHFTRRCPHCSTPEDRRPTLQVRHGAPGTKPVIVCVRCGQTLKHWTR